MSDRDVISYEMRYPGTGIPDAQKEERWQRESFKGELASHHRTGRNRTVIFTADNPWLNSLDNLGRR